MMEHDTEHGQEFAHFWGITACQRVTAERLDQDHLNHTMLLTLFRRILSSAKFFFPNGFPSFLSQRCRSQNGAHQATVGAFANTS